MNDEHPVRTMHVFAMMFLTVGSLVAIGLFHMDGWMMLGFIVLAFMSFVLAILFAVFVSINQRAAFYNKITEFGQMLVQLDRERWGALGIQFPTLRIRYRHIVKVCIEDTDITIEDFERFMQDSNTRYISPERNWSNGRARAKWLEIKTFLQSESYIFEDKSGGGAAGQHSWMWRADGYTRAWDYLLFRPRQSNTAPVDTFVEGERKAIEVDEPNQISE